MYEERDADKARHLELNSAKEVKCNALVHSARYLQSIRRYHDHNIQERSFSIGDLVLHRIQDETAQLAMGRAFHHLKGYKSRVDHLQYPDGRRF
jgi:hypothetical protein